MTDIVKGMAGAYLHALNGPDDLTCEEAMRAALLWLANNVSDEMGVAAVVRWQNGESKGCLQEWLQEAIAAAIRAAAGGEEGK